MYDILIIGGGVIGCNIARELSEYKLSVILLEKEDDVAQGASKANSGIVHAGYDCKPGTLKALHNRKGAEMYPSLCDMLGVPYRNSGSLVVCDNNGLDGLKDLEKKGQINGVKVEILNRDQLFKLEPNLAEDIEYGLYAPTAGIVSPYKFTIANADYAIINGVKVKVDAEVVDIEKFNSYFNVMTQKQDFQAKYVINCAGGGATKINQLLGAEEYPIAYRRGDYYLLDHSEAKNVNTVIFPLPDEKGKGILVAPTVDDNVIYGPTSIEVADYNDTAVGNEGLDEIKKGVTKTYKSPNFRKAIRVYAGVRAISGDDFVIEESDLIDNYFYLIGVCSPGLTSAPSIAKDVKDVVIKKFDCKKKTNSELKPAIKHNYFNKLSQDEYEKLVSADKKWGRIICRCEKITEAEIVDAIHSPLPAVTTDAIKRRTRSGMGRCQGGFCQARVMEIIARECNLPLTNVNKGGTDSNIAVDVVKSDIITSER